MKTKYTTIFSSHIKPLVPEDKDKYLALASMVNLEGFLPKIDTEENYDLLPIAFNAFVANRVNKNGDVVDTETAVAMYKNFINKPVNIEHNRKSVIGTILTAGFSSFGEDKPLTEEEVKDMKSPFNVTLGGLVWKIIDKELSDKIENSSDPTSEDYMNVSASWELGFSDYNLVVLEGEEKNIENATEISDPKEVEKLQDKLRGFGGEGKLEDGTFVYRKVINKVIPLGIGLTESPAADVKGIATASDEEEAESIRAHVRFEPKTSDLKQEKISQNTKTNVNIEKVGPMRIENITDITDESLQTLKASAIHEYIQESLKDASEKFTSEKQEKEDALSEAREQHDSLVKEHDSLKAELESVQEKLNTLDAEKVDREQLEQFNQRMASFDERYDLTDEDRKVLAAQVKDLSEEQFTSFDQNMSVLLSSKEKGKEEVKEEVEASTPEEVVESAVENAEVDKETVPVSAPAEDPSITEKYSKAFNIDQFDIKM
jgi:tetrahydromethanopterin S-methyltransferase subunit A